MTTNDERRVAITGMGIISPIGENLADYLAALRQGCSGITRWKQLDERCYSRIGGDLSDFDLAAHLEHVGIHYPEALVQMARKLLRATPLSGRLTTAAALQAFVHAGLHETPVAPARIGHILAGHNLNGPYIHDNAMTYREEPEFIDPLYGVMYLDTDVLAVIAQLLNLRGPCFSVGGACASGNLALLASLDLLRAGRADALVVSGAASPLGFVTRQAWSLIDALSIRSFNDTPTQASRPFDARREGFVPSEGAAVVVLETFASAQRRGAPIHAELMGAASTSNASRTTKPDLEAQVRVMGDALRDAGLVPEQVDYINAHATSTPLGDAVEVQAIKQLFGAHAYAIPVNATKSLVGHCLTSAAIVELVATVLQIQHNFVHPTINQTVADPELDLDFVPNQARPHQIQVALSNAFGFGGLNACVVVGANPYPQ